MKKAYIILGILGILELIYYAGFGIVMGSKLMVIMVPLFTGLAVADGFMKNFWGKVGINAFLTLCIFLYRLLFVAIWQYSFC